MLALFGFFITIAAGFGPLMWIIGVFCLLFYRCLIVYGLVACIIVGAPFWVYLIGFLCFLFDANL